MTRDTDGPMRPTDHPNRDLAGGDAPELDESTANQFLTDPDAPLRTELGVVATVKSSTEGAV